MIGRKTEKLSRKTEQLGRKTGEQRERKEEGMQTEIKKDYLLPDRF